MTLYSGAWVIEIIDTGIFQLPSVITSRMTDFPSRGEGGQLVAFKMQGCVVVVARTYVYVRARSLGTKLCVPRVGMGLGLGGRVRGWGRICRS